MKFINILKRTYSKRLGEYLESQKTIFSFLMTLILFTLFNIYFFIIAIAGSTVHYAIKLFDGKGLDF